jgi:hypothetical protein
MTDKPTIDDSDDDTDYDRLDEIESAIRRLAKRRRGPQDMAKLLAGDDGAIELIAAAERDDLADVGDAPGMGETAAEALGYLAGLALILRQALRHHAGWRVERSAGPAPASAPEEMNDAAREGLASAVIEAWRQREGESDAEWERRAKAKADALADEIRTRLGQAALESVIKVAGRRMRALASQAEGLAP